jgi:hypothetical protein
MAGCSSCMKAKANSMRQQGAAAQRSLASSPAGYSADNPVIIGGASDDAARRVRVASPVGNLRVQQAAWVAGTGVQPLLEDGTFVEIGSTPQKRRLWKVGVASFTDEGEANAAAAALGLVAVEVA